MTWEEAVAWFDTLTEGATDAARARHSMPDVVEGIRQKSRDALAVFRHEKDWWE